MEKVASVWFLPAENTWKDFNLMAMKDEGTLYLKEDELIFDGSKYKVSVKDIVTISYGKQGRDFINNWIKIEYESDDNVISTIFFADGKMLGWSGIFGGTKKLFKRIKDNYSD
ncbi:MAG: hypothetical protein AAF849_06195 [Bacteroidota bacterium]